MSRAASSPHLHLVQGAGHPAPLRLERLSPSREGAWDEFVRGADGATPFHLVAWRRVVEGSFGHHPYYLLALRGGEIRGVLPLFHLQSWLFGRSLVSLPAAIGGGVLSADAEAGQALLREAQRLAGELAVDYLELRSERPIADELPAKDLYVTFRADLREGEEVLLRRMGRKRRQMMTYAARTGFEGREGLAEELPLFYRLFCLSMRSHGTPVYPYGFLERILREYRGEANLYFAYRDGRPLAGALSFLFRGAIMPFYAGTDRSSRLRGVDDFLYWSLMGWAREKGFHTFDFGRSKRGTGAHKFKASWGMEEVPLVYQYHLVRAREIPNVSPANARYDRAVRVWRRLPLPLTRLLGPMIVSRIP